ncbi:MAG: N-acetylmuramoyl-L-alanine amidase [Betaproteobacteria bacterium]|nr:N-acetylmuramoyl-L-alanine amidase [Betaproteobacteria bacterium]
MSGDIDGPARDVFEAARTRRSIRAYMALLALTVAACAPLPQRANVPVVQRPSPNFDERRPGFVILHHTSDDTAEQALSTLTDPARKVSSHYLISRNGRIHYLVDEQARAWHAGESYWSGHHDLNSASIGIELDNSGEESFPEAQIESLLALLADIKERYGLPAANFLGHGDVAPGRKTDPSRYFPWRRLAERGFGLWCDPPYPPAPPGLDAAMLLDAFGYDISRPYAAVAAFKRRFSPDDPSEEMTERDRALLYCLLSRKRER